MKQKSGIYFTNNTTPNILGEFSLILTSIFFEVQNNNLIYSKGKAKLKASLFWSISGKLLEELETKELPLEGGLEISIKQNDKIIASYPIALHDKEEIFGDEIEIFLQLKDFFTISLESKEQDLKQEFLINSGFLVINEV